MGYDVLELRELEYERYKRHSVVLEYNCLKWWKQRAAVDPYCEILVNGSRLQELLAMSLEGVMREVVLEEIGWFEGFRDMLQTKYGRCAGYEYSYVGYFPILCDGLHNPVDEGDVAVHVKLEGDEVVWDGYFWSYSLEWIDHPVKGPTFRFRREQYEAAIRALCAYFGLEPS